MVNGPGSAVYSYVYSYDQKNYSDEDADENFLQPISNFLRRCHDTVTLSWWTNSSNSVFREMSLPRTAEAAVIRNLSLGGSGGNRSVAHYLQVNLKSSGNIVVQGETRSFTVADLTKFKETLAVTAAADPPAAQALSTPLVVLLAVVLVLAALSAALFLVRRHKARRAAEKGRGAAIGGGAVHFGDGSRIEMYGEATRPESGAAAAAGESLLGDLQVAAAASPIPEWPEPPPQWPEPGA